MLRLGFARVQPGWTEADVDREYPRLLRFYEEAIDNQTRAYPGAAEAVEALRAAGYRTGICTNKPERLSRILLDRLALSDLFDALVGADTLPVRKPDPAPLPGRGARGPADSSARSLLVGDTDTDRRDRRRRRGALRAGHLRPRRPRGRGAGARGAAGWLCGPVTGGGAAPRLRPD